MANPTLFLNVDPRGISEFKPLVFSFADALTALGNNDTLSTTQPGVTATSIVGANPLILTSPAVLDSQTSTWTVNVSVSQGKTNAEYTVTCTAQTVAGFTLEVNVNVVLVGPGFSPPSSPIPGPANQNPGTFFRGPVSSPPAPASFGPLVVSDIPTLPPSILGTAPPNEFLGGPTSGPAASVSPRVIVTTDLPTNRSGVPLVTLTDASTINIDLSTGSNFYLLFTSAVGASRTLTVTNATKGQQWSLQTQQPASGGPCTATFFSGITWSQGYQPPFSIGPNTVDTWEFNTSTGSPGPTFVGSTHTNSTVQYDSVGIGAAPAATQAITSTLTVPAGGSSASTRFSINANVNRTVGASDSGLYTDTAVQGVVTVSGIATGVPAGTSYELIASEFIANYNATGATRAPNVGGLDTRSRPNTTDHIAACYGGQCFASPTGGCTVDTAVGMFMGIASGSAGTNVSLGAGLFIISSITHGGTIGQNYGLYIASQTSGTSNYSIYTNAGQVHFGDNTTMSGMSPGYAAKAASYALTKNDAHVDFDATSGALTATLPLASSVPAGQEYTIKKIDSSANSVTATASGSDLIDGSNTASLTTRYQELSIYGDGVSNWRVVTSGASSGPTGNYRHVTTITNVSASDFTISGDATAASFNVNLLPSKTAPANRAITILKTDATVNTVTLVPGQSNPPMLDLVNGQTSYVLAGQFSSVTIEPDGVSNWFVTAME